MITHTRNNNARVYPAEHMNQLLITLYIQNPFQICIHILCMCYLDIAERMTYLKVMIFIYYIHLGMSISLIFGIAIIYKRSNCNIIIFSQDFIALIILISWVFIFFVMNLIRFSLVQMQLYCIAWAWLKLRETRMRWRQWRPAKNKIGS